MTLIKSYIAIGPRSSGFAVEEIKTSVASAFDPLLVVGSLLKTITLIKYNTNVKPPSLSLFKE